MAWKWAGLAAMAVAMAAGTADRAPSAPAIAKLLACREVTDTSARLGCFDKAAAALGGAVSSGSVVVVEKAQVRAAQRASFGLPPPGLEVFAGKDGQRLSRVETKIAAGSINQFGKVLVTLADGSRWHQIDDYPLSHGPKPGDPVVISRAAIGSFKMAIAGQTAVRVVRDR